MTRLPYAADGDGVRLALRVTPRAKRSSLAGLVEDRDGGQRVAVRLAAPPVDCAANKELIAFLAKALGVPRSAVEIVAGHASRLKTVRIAGISAESIAEWLG